MLFKSIKIWLFFIICFEMIYLFEADNYDQNVLKFLIIKLLTYGVCYIILNLRLMTKQFDEMTILRINIGAICLLISLLDAVFFAIILKEAGNIGWILFLVFYVGEMIFCFLSWKKSDASNANTEETQKDKHVPSKTLGWSAASVGILLSRYASDGVYNLVETTLFMILIYLLLFFSLLSFIKCKEEWIELFK